MPDNADFLRFRPRKSSGLSFGLFRLGWPKLPNPDHLDFDSGTQWILTSVFFQTAPNLRSTNPTYNSARTQSVTFHIEWSMVRSTFFHTFVSRYTYRSSPTSIGLSGSSNSRAEKTVPAGPGPPSSAFIPSKTVAAATLPRFVFVAGLCSCVSFVPLSAVPAIASGARVTSLTCTSSSTPPTLAVAVRLGRSTGPRRIPHFAYEKHCVLPTPLFHQLLRRYRWYD